MGDLTRAQLQHLLGSLRIGQVCEVQRGTSVLFESLQASYMARFAQGGEKDYRMDFTSIWRSKTYVSNKYS
jgi:hypothetical protein